MSGTESSGTHPVYIGEDLKKEVKMQATEKDQTMREIAERLVTRGLSRGLHEDPLPSEFRVEIGRLRKDVNRARDSGDLDRVEQRLERLRNKYDGANIPEENDLDDEMDVVEDQIEALRDDLEE